MLQAINVVKAFGTVVAVDNVSFSVKAGEVHALLGENGAGKSTVLRLLAGDYQLDSGEIRLNDERLAFTHPAQALEHGIACVHQQPLFVANLSVTENLFLGLPYSQRHAGLIDWPAEHREARRVLAELGLYLDPRRRMSDLAVHERQFVALARVLQHNPRVVLLDEITASLAEAEVHKLFEVVRQVRDRQVAIVYVSHRLEEVFDIADRVTVLRDAKHIATSPVKDLTHERLTELIVGQSMKTIRSEMGLPEEPQASQPVLVARGIGDGERVTGISFNVHGGEVVGVAGLAGAGQNKLMRMLFGAAAVHEGEMLLDGSTYSPRDPSEAINAGVAMVTEDRAVDGLVMAFPVWQNVTLPWVRMFRRHGFVRLAHERDDAASHAGRLGVRMPSIDARMSMLSGGNQQKVVMAKWTRELPRLLILSDPTHGVDIRSRFEIYALLRDMARDGVAIIVASAELAELETVCNRVLLLRQGRLVGEVKGDDVNQEQILSMLLLPLEGAVEGAK